MCIIFLWRGVSRSNYKFILAANRDEYFSRPAKPASFWEGSDSHILAGQDLTEGYEGGTWLGITRSGRVCFLTNISTNEFISSTQKGRGQLVADFLRNEINPSDYLLGLEKIKKTFRPFNLVAGLIDSDFIYISTENNLCTLEKGYLCLTNSSLNKPCLKALNSLNKFKDLLHGEKEIENIHEKLFALLADTTKNTDLCQESSDEWNSSIYIDPTIAPFENANVFGTRTSTVITVDTNNHVVFQEKTKTDANQQLSDWLSNTYEYDIIK
ncbi:transport and Golgi organization protein 2 homolog [Hydra vulgaris]|uniref:Transport and Golgi organization protein 2 homolog n=1 Tax=Hydra vulgaris TaxID=6087 RepID=A0ABM4CQU7_HYDVU